MTAILNEDSAPTHCGLVTYERALLARLLHLPPGVRVDQVTIQADMVEILVSGGEDTKLPLVEPGFPIPNVQVGVILDDQQRVAASAILPINADLGALDIVKGETNG